MNNNSFALFVLFLKLCVFRCAWERNYISDICHSCGEQYQSFDSYAKTGVRPRSRAAWIQGPVHLVFRRTRRCHTSRQFFSVFFTLRSADHLADTWEQDVHSTYCVAALCIYFILLHVE